MERVFEGRGGLVAAVQHLEVVGPGVGGGGGGGVAGGQALAQHGVGGGELDERVREVGGAQGGAERVAAVGVAVGGVQHGALQVLAALHGAALQRPVRAVRHAAAVEVRTRGGIGALVEGDARQGFADRVGGDVRPAEGLGQGGRLRALAGAGPPEHDDYQGGGAGDGVAEGPAVVALGAHAALQALAGGHLLRLCPDAFHLAPDVGAVALVEVDEPIDLRVAHRLGHLCDEAIPEVGPPVQVQVHRQEGNVVGDVEVAKVLVELNAVVDADVVVGEVDVFEAQVAVAVHDEAPGPAAVEEGRVLVEEPVGVVPQRVVGGAGEKRPDVIGGLLEVARHPGLQAVGPSGRRHRRR